MAGKDRRQKCKPLAACRVAGLAIDGYNILITGESALAGGLPFRARDGGIRDLAGVHGSWRRVEETERAVRLVAGALNDLLQSNPVFRGSSLRNIELMRVRFFFRQKM